jgi:hypothetical protein
MEKAYPYNMPLLELRIGPGGFLNRGAAYPNISAGPQAVPAAGRALIDRG